VIKGKKGKKQEDRNGKEKLIVRKNEQEMRENFNFSRIFVLSFERVFYF